MTEITGRFSHALLTEMLTRPGRTKAGDDMEELLRMFKGDPDNLEKFLRWLDRRGLEIRKKQ